ncbi:MAG TPA: extracellular solute-binding protein, partial [Acidimicrobiales bacterium]|nr:extracellular solute-binding protein [Acidimicrobiales bacterium]
MSHYQGKKSRSWVKGATAVGAAALTAAGVTFPSTAFAATSKISGTLKIITWVNPPAVMALTKIDKEFEQKYPGVTVQLQTEANDTAGYATLLETSVDSGSADIVTDVNSIQPLPLNANRTTMSQTEFWASSGAYLPLNNQPWIHDFSSTALAQETYKGQIYGVLSGQYQRVLFYNKADFAKYHLSVPTTYNQFLTVLQTLKSHGVQPLWLGVGGGAAGYVQQFFTNALTEELWLPHVPGQNVNTDLQTGATTWTSPYFVQAEKEEAAIGKYLEPNYTGASWEAMPQDFASNKGAILVDGSWDLATVHQANPSLQVGSFPLPGSNIASQNQPQLQPDLNFEVLKKAQNIPAALAYLAFFASKPIYEQYVDTTGISPSETGGTYSNFAAGVLGKWLGKGIEYTSSFPTLTATQGYYDTATEFPLLQENVISGSITPQKAAQEIQSSWKK